MSEPAPKEKGYNDNNNCSRCDHDEFEESSEYDHPDYDNPVKDIFCQNCGSILEIREITEGNDE